jgi:hypothetical protein
MHSNFYRGQHPHAMNNFMQDTGPETWTNPIEIGRIHWEHRHLGELAEGFDPLTHYDPAIPAGQRASNLDKYFRVRERMRQGETGGDVRPERSFPRVWTRLP